MKIEVEHIGKVVRYGSNAPFTIEGFERHGTMLYMYGTGLSEGARPSTPLHPDKKYYCVNGGYTECFRFVEPIESEFDFSRFGCQEKNVRDLMDYLDKRYQKVKS